ncbi:MAG: glycosyltransferase family 2 protein [Veillonellales bacterium]
MVYIILINYNSWQDTLECLASLKQLTFLNYKIIIIDNASQDESVQQISRNYPDAVIISSQENLGFAGGNQLGIDFALKEGAKYIWLLNNDTVVHKESLTELVHNAESFPLALLTNKIYKYGTERDIWYCGGDIHWWKGKPFHIRMHQQDDQFAKQPYATTWISGCSMFAKAELFQNYHMDKRYFLYFEDVEFCEQLKKGGISLFVIPKSIIWHKTSASIGKMSHIQAYYSVRNNMYFVSKQANLIHKVVYFPYFIVRTLIFSLRYRLRGWKNKDSLKSMVGKAYWRGLIDFFCGKYGKLK